MCVCSSAILRSLFAAAEKKLLPLQSLLHRCNFLFVCLLKGNTFTFSRGCQKSNYSYSQSGCFVGKGANIMKNGQLLKAGRVNCNLQHSLYLKNIVLQIHYFALLKKRVNKVSEETSLSQPFLFYLDCYYNNPSLLCASPSFSVKSFTNSPFLLFMR